MYLSSALAALLLAPVAVLAQSGSVGIGTTAPDASAVLDLTSATKGLLIPRLDSAARVAIATPATGLLVFQTSPRPGFYYYSGSAWLFLPDKARGGDNLGNHTATRKLDLGTNQLVGNGGTSGLAISSGGNVGIGTAAPAAPLHVVGSSYQAALLESTAAGPHLTLRKPGAGEANVDYIGTDSDDGRAGALELRGVSSVQVSGDGNPSSPDLTVTAAGRVGVGTTAPAAPLEVQAGTVLTGSNTGTETELRLSRPGTVGSKWNASAELALGTYAPGGNAQSQLDFRLGNGSSNAADQTVLTLRGDGRVGVGVAEPASQLANTASNIVGTDGLGVNSSSLSWLSSNQGYAAAIQNQWSAFGGNGLAIKVADAGGYSTALDVSQGSSSAAGISLLRVRSDGSVGIGVAVPAARLDVAGSVRLRGLTTAGVVTTDASGNLGSVAASTLADNLGNHTATQPLNLQGNALTGTGASIGSTVGLGVRADGGLNIGQNTPGNNILIGYQAGAALTTGIGNQFIGYRAGNATTTGFNNYFSGYQSGYQNTGGNSNLFSGYQSGFNNTQGYANLFEGLQSGYSNTTGYFNQFVGFRSGYSNTTGNYNWAFGYQAGPTVGNLTNAGAIGNQAQVSQSNSLVLGGTGANAVGVGIGTTAPDASAVLDLTSATKGLLIPRLDSAARVAIATPATGLLVFQTSPRPGFYYYSGSAWLFLPDKARGGDNLGNHTATQPLNLQAQALIGTGADLGSAVGVGVRADGGLNIGQSVPGSNVLIGYQAGSVLNASSGGFFNTFLGYQSGRNATTGGDNLFAGNESGLVNTTGYQNTFAGSRVGRANTQGNRNAFFGFSSGASNTEGSDNVFVGYQSGWTSMTGNNNVFVGNISGYSNGSGQNNWALGYDAGPATGGLTNAGAIGYRAHVSQSSSLVLGGTGADAVKVGIGTTAPAAPLEVQAGTALTGLNTGTETELRLTRPGTSGSKWNASAELALGTYAIGIDARSQLDFRLGNGPSNAPDQTVLTLRGDGRAEVARKVTTPATGPANVLAAGYGNVFGAGTLANATSNVSVSHTVTGEYLLTFTGPLATADFGSTALSLTLFNGPGFVSYSSAGSAGQLLVRTFNSSGTLTDRGFSFVVFQP